MKKCILVAAALVSGLSLNSCVWQIVTQHLVRPDYPSATRPPHVIADVNGQPASRNWVKVDPEALPPSGSQASRNINYHSSGIPYGMNSEFSDIVLSPYDPHYPLDYRGVNPGTKVWDPYTRKPFYIPRAFKLN